MKTIAQKPITTLEVFEDKTCVLLNILLDQILMEDDIVLPVQDCGWFLHHVSCRLRWFHANNKAWATWLENRNRYIDPRCQAAVWIRHWLMAYVLNPERYHTQMEGIYHD